MCIRDSNNVVRRWINWAQGRVKEPLLWEFAHKSGACFDWLYDLATKKGLEALLLSLIHILQANEICKGPRFYATKLNDSNAYSWMEVVGRPRVYVQWGGASELSNYDDSCRTTVDVATRADKHILVDPRQTNLGKEADIWVNLRPGTDGAVANCWANVIIENELYDDLYVRKWICLLYTSRCV